MAGMKLQDRERRMLIGGGIAGAAILVFLFGEGPLQAYRESEQKLEQARTRLKQAQAIHDSVVRKREEAAVLREKLANTTGFDLLTFVNDIVRRGGLSARASIDNSGRATAGSADLASVRVTLKGVSLAELVDFLHEIYGSGRLVVLHNLDQLEPAADQKGLDCDMIFVAPRA
jgi:type II secretory pathway component PulM